MDELKALVMPPVARRWLLVLSLGVIANYAVFFIVFFNRSGPKDSDQFLVFHSLQYWNAAMFGLAKQWTPLLCAGLSMAGEPQVPFMSLSMALSYVLGPLWGIRLATAIYLLAGWVGAYLYAGLWLRTFSQRSLAAALFIGNGFFFCRLGFGHFDFVPFLILPLMLWALHEGSTGPPPAGLLVRSARLGMVALLMGASMSMAIDGSPVAIIHLLFWIGLYALALAWTRRSPMPAVIFSLALGTAILLDAGYLWPMLQSQAAFPRLTPDRFTSVFSLLWFALLPARGKVLPANGNGHELSVFIGPVVAYCLWRYRHWLSVNLPGEMRRPLLVVSVVSIVLGMGSLKVLHIPVWLSPFDALRPLPGFRSIGVTGRYWGFLALPLSLLGAAALCKYAADSRPGWRVHVFFGAALALHLGFQVNTLWVPWLNSPNFRAVLPGEHFRRGPETIEYLAIRDDRLQGEVIAPTRGVSDCYDMDDFRHADIGPGSLLIRHVSQDGKPMAKVLPIHAQFSKWSHIRLGLDCPAGALSCPIGRPSRLQMELGQAYHPLWEARGCALYPSKHGNMIVDCPAARWLKGDVELDFDDTTSDFAAHISTMAWTIWLPSTGFLMLVCFPGRMRSRRFAPVVTA